MIMPSLKLQRTTKKTAFSRASLFIFGRSSYVVALVQISSEEQIAAELFKNSYPDLSGQFIRILEDSLKQMALPFQ